MGKYCKIVISFFVINLLNAQAVHIGGTEIINSNQAPFPKPSFNAPTQARKVPTQENAKSLVDKKIAEQVVKELFNEHAGVDRHLTEKIEKMSQQSDTDNFFKVLKDELDREVANQSANVTDEKVLANNFLRTKIKDRVSDPKLDKAAFFKSLIKSRTAVSSFKSWEVDLRTGGVVGNGVVEMASAPRANNAPKLSQIKKNLE